MPLYRLRKFASLATKAAVMQCINPAALNMKVNRIALRPNCKIIIEGDQLNDSALRNSASLSAVGLEVSSDVKMNPRSIGHDIGWS